MRTARRILFVVGIPLLLVYLSGPVIASILEAGDRRGPRLYPVWLHEPIYMLVWEMTPHEASKPRIPAVWRSEHRPWFYGQYSRNSDPAWLEAEYEDLHERLDEERAISR